MRSNSLFDSKMAVGALYRSELAATLQRELGFAIERVESWFEIRSVKPELAAEFSTRRQQILQFCEAEGKYGALEAQTAALANRAAQQSRLRARRIRRQGVDIQGTKFHGNDRIHFRNGHRDLGIRPGNLGTVMRVTKSALTVTLDQGRRVLIPLAKCPKVTLGYAFAHADARDLKPRSAHVLFEANDTDKEARSILNRSRETKVRVYTEEWNFEALSASVVDKTQQRRQESSRSQPQHERGSEEDRRRENSKDQGHEQSQ